MKDEDIYGQNSRKLFLIGFFKYFYCINLQKGPSFADKIKLERRHVITVSDKFES